MSPAFDEINRLHAELCTAISDPIRIAILYALDEEPCNVSNLTARLSLPQSTVSRHLRILRTTGLVRAHRSGQRMIYELSDRRVIAALDLMRNVLTDRVSGRMELLPGA